MKRLIIITLFTLVGLSGCYKESDMRYTPTEPEYDLSDSSSDPIQHERFLMYRDYGVILIDDVVPADYLYTLTGASNIRITKSSLSQADKLRAIELVRTLIFDAFPEEHLKRFPLKFILGEQVYEEYKTPVGVSRNDLNAHLGPYYFAFAITRSVLNDPSTNTAFASRVLSEFVIKGVLERKYGEDYRELFTDIYNNPDEFRSGFYVTYGDMNPGQIPGTSLELPPADYPYEDFALIEDFKDYAYNLGLPSVVYEASKSQYYEKDEWRVYLKKDQFIPGYLVWSFLTDEQEKGRVVAEYPEFKRRYEIFKGLIEKYVDLKL